MAKHHHDHQRHDPPDHGRTSVPKVIIIRGAIIFIRDTWNPRYLGWAERVVRSRAPSRAATRFSVAIIVFVLALVAIACASAIVGK